MSAPVAAAAGEAAGAATAAPAAEAATTGAGTAQAAGTKAPAKKAPGSTRRRKPVDQGYIDALKKGDQKKGKPKPGPDSDAEPETTEVRLPSFEVPAVVDTGAGVILGVLFWWWVGLPFIQGGLKGVQAQVRAKFFNKAADGSWLP